MAIVSVEVDLDEFGDEDLLDEVKKRGLLKAENSDFSEVISLLENSTGAAVIKTGIGEAFSVSIAGSCAYTDNGRSTIIVINGE